MVFGMPADRNNTDHYRLSRDILGENSSICDQTATTNKEGEQQIVLFLGKVPQATVDLVF